MSKFSYTSSSGVCCPQALASLLERFPAGSDRSDHYCPPIYILAPAMAHLNEYYGYFLVLWMASSVDYFRRQIANLLTSTSSPAYRSRSSRNPFLTSNRDVVCVNHCATSWLCSFTTVSTALYTDCCSASLMHLAVANVWSIHQNLPFTVLMYRLAQSMLGRMASSHTTLSHCLLG